MPRHINAAGFQLIKDFEGLRLKAYPDPGTGDVPWTIGFGSTVPVVHKGDVITLEQANERLANDLRKFESAVANLAPVTTDNQFAALVSFAFNCGIGNLEESTLLRMHRDGQYTSARAQFARWNKAAGKPMAGLTRRRAAEAALYGAP
jgi:lysozyme